MISLGRSIFDDLSLFKPSNPGTIAFEKVHTVGNDNDGFVGFEERLDTALGFATKPFIANREDFVDEKNVRIRIGGHREAEPRSHAGRIGR